MPIVSLPTRVSLYYEERGTGDPVLLIMGTGADHSLWDATADALASRHRVITFDNRGTGLSDHPADPSDYTMRVLADDAAALLEVIGIERAHVAGCSLGSTVAQELAINHPEKVASLQLHCTWGKTDAWLDRLFRGMAYPVEHEDMAAFAVCAFMWVLSPTYLNDFPEQVAEIEAAYLANPPSKAGLLGHLHADRTHDALERLGEIRAPTLITSGEMDWQIPTRYGREVEWWIPGSRMHVFEGPFSSHCAFIEMADEFNEVSLAFIAEHLEH
jgi:pimeloyl-ACP methyl ester carboxylesterase